MCACVSSYLSPCFFSTTTEYVSVEFDPGGVYSQNCHLNYICCVWAEHHPYFTWSSTHYKHLLQHISKKCILKCNILISVNLKTILNQVTFLRRKLNRIVFIYNAILAPRNRIVSLKMNMQSVFAPEQVVWQIFVAVFYRDILAAGCSNIGLQFP